MRALTRGERVSDPQLAPSVLAYAQVVMASARKQQDRHVQWVFLAVAALGLALAVTDTIRGPVRPAVVFWVVTATAVGLGLWLPWGLERQRARAEAAADSAADQIGGLSAD